MSSRLWELVDKYEKAAKILGVKPLNGMDKAELYIALKEGGGEQILEMVELIRKHDEQQAEFDKMRELAGANPNPPVGTIWTTDATHYNGDVIGITQSGTSIKIGGDNE